MCATRRARLGGVSRRGAKAEQALLVRGQRSGSCCQKAASCVSLCRERGRRGRMKGRVSSRGESEAKAKATVRVTVQVKVKGGREGGRRWEREREGCVSVISPQGRRAHTSAQTLFWSVLPASHLLGRPQTSVLSRNGDGKGREHSETRPRWRRGQRCLGAQTISSGSVPALARAPASGQRSLNLVRQARQDAKGKRGQPSHRVASWWSAAAHSCARLSGASPVTLAITRAAPSPAIAHHRPPSLARQVLPRRSAPGTLPSRLSRRPSFPLRAGGPSN